MTNPKIAFVYLLNRMENAGAAKEPSKAGFGEHRQAVVDHVNRIEAELADARAALREHIDSALKHAAFKRDADGDASVLGGIIESMCDDLERARAILAKQG